MKLIEKIEGEQIKKQVPFHVGDSVKVHTRVREGEKERVQIFAGVVIGHKGRGLNESFTVRRISYGEGVERVFPVNSPRIEKIEVEREGKVRRAKLFYLRGRKGKEALFVKERVSATVAKKAKASAKRAKAKEVADAAKA
jgi:large subunit ribosomal protein L19